MFNILEKKQKINRETPPDTRVDKEMMPIEKKEEDERVNKNDNTKAKHYLDPKKKGKIGLEKVEGDKNLIDSSLMEGKINFEEEHEEMDDSLKIVIEDCKKDLNKIKNPDLNKIAVEIINNVEQDEKVKFFADYFSTEVLKGLDEKYVKEIDFIFKNIYKDLAGLTARKSRLNASLIDKSISALSDKFYQTKRQKK